MNRTTMERKNIRAMARTVWMLALAAGMALSFGNPATAQNSVVPSAISYQGVLKDSLASPLQGTQNATFRIYSESSGGTPLWQKTMDIHCATNGLFHAILSDETSGEDEGSAVSLMEVFNASPRLLEITVANHGEAIAPRMDFTTIPNALAAGYARYAAVAFLVKSNLTVSNTLTIAKNISLGRDANLGSAVVAGDVSFGEAVTARTVTASRFSGDGIAPVGSIVMWNRPESEIPAGWVVCNGQTVDGVRTPDLRSRFLVGVGNGYALGQTGGAESVALTTDQIPAHTHTYTTASDRTFNYAAAWGKSDWWQNSTHGDHQNGTTDKTGNGQAHENRPPYYAMYFIMRVQ